MAMRSKNIPIVCHLDSGAIQISMPNNPGPDDTNNDRLHAMR